MSETNHLKKKNKSVGRQSIKLIYEKDVSEHCRRRVMPSIFLGREVIEANARIIQFSSLELPYSCSVSIRTESGSSMVMMIQVLSRNVEDACKDSPQLLVYEMGESFGGYWGPIPETVIKRDPPAPTAYTLKTTELTMPATESLEEENETETTQESTTSSKRVSEDLTSDYVEVEIPLLNVSAHYGPTKKGQTDPSNGANTFDLRQDVTPIEGVAYDRSILPLVQFHLLKQPNGRRNDDGGDGQPPKYELDILQDFSPDIRLTLPEFKPTYKRKHKQSYQATRRLTFKKHRTLFHSQRHSGRHVTFKTKARKNDVTKYTFPARNIEKDQSKNHRDSWRVVEDLVKKLNKIKAKTLQTTLSLKDAKFLERISNIEHKKSAYLSSNLSKYGDTNKYLTTNALLSIWEPVSVILNATELLIEATEEYNSKKSLSRARSEIESSTIVEDITIHQSVQIDKISKSSDSITESLNSKDALTDQQLSLAFKSSRMLDSTTQINVLKKNSVSESETKSNIPIEKTTVSKSPSAENVDSKNKLNKIVTGSMVGHESWENLVQVAPEMAFILNQTADDVSRGNASDDITKEINEAPLMKNMLQRKKRDIHAIAIENAHPRNITTRKTVDTTTQITFDIGDMQEFAQLVELQDDEMIGRVALQNVYQFTGLPFFNLCEIADPTKPHVHLFNSSRIILAPTNFTLERMVIILTAARALLADELRCPRAMIECQVSGARVCLDSMAACDGVPNCGFYEIYDEDRLLCGHTAALQHNVYLAAFTFLAVLLTIIYTVHYWLKQCVPKVAEAFFVYSDGVENMLYLDSVMRSPHETEDRPKVVYHSHMYGDENIYDEYVSEPFKSTCLRFLKNLFSFRRRTPNKIDERFTSPTHLHPLSSKKTYSFTALEIHKMLTSFTCDIGVQTGDSLEMRPLKNAKGNKTAPSTNQKLLKRAATSFDSMGKVTDSLLTMEEPLPEEHADELSLLKFFKATARNRRKSSTYFHRINTDSIESDSEISSAENKVLESRNRIDSPSEREIEIHTYDRHGLLEPTPGPSTRLGDNRQLPLTDSVSKHLRFDDLTTTIPPARWYVEEDGVINYDGRRSVALGERPRGSRLLDTIDEADEQGGAKEHRYFWGSSKAKKTKKKTQVSHR